MRNVPAAFQAHLDSGATTITYLMKIDPVQPGFSTVGVTMLDQPVTYDDGAGPLLYEAAIGMVPATLSFTSEMDVDNSQQQHLIPEFDLPISEADLVSGAYDFANFVLYMVNYESLSDGHLVIASGQLGRMIVKDGLAFTSELTGISKQLKQSIVEKDSMTCRAIFGSQPIGTGGGVVEQKFPCGFDADSILIAGSVDSVGFETNRTFTDAGLVQAAGYFEPGMLYWTGGANDGRAYEVESFGLGGVVGLTFETMFPIQAGDTFNIRQDCTKWKDGDRGCKYHFGVPEWKLHYRGEPLIPVEDSDQLNTPGASVGAGLGGSTTSSPS